MKCPNSRYSMGLAEPGDAAQLLRIYESGDFPGDVSVLYTRRPDPIQSLRHEGEKTVIPVVRDLEKGLIVGMGACVIRKAYINGEIRRTGYLTGLKSLPDYRLRVPLISQTYRYLYEQTRDEVDVYYTTILKDNAAAQKMLAKKRPGMPEYRRVGDYTVYCLRTGVRTRAAKGWTLDKGSLAELEGLDIWQPERYDFSPPDTALYGLEDGDVFFLRDPAGQVAAACSLWNQKSWKQYIITGYRGLYKWLSRVPLKLTGYPDLPRAGAPVNYAALSLLTVREGDLAAAAQLIRLVAEKAAGVDFLMLGLFENHPLQPVMAKMKCVRYQSILYTVHWADGGLEIGDRPVNLEIGLL